MKKILVLIDTLDISGAANSLYLMFKNIDRKAYDINIFVADKKLNNPITDMDYIKILDSSFLHPNKIQNKLKRYVYSFFYLLSPRFIFRKKIASEKYDILIDYKCTFPKLLLALKAEKKIIWIHGDVKTNESFCKVKFLKKIVMLRAFKRANRIFCVSKTMKNRFIEKYGNKYNVDYIYNIFDSENILNMSHQDLDIIKSDKIVFTCVSRLVEHKGIDRLINVVKRLNNIGYTNYEIHLIGDGPLLEKYNGILDNVNFFGKKKNPYPYILKSDLTICPSESEAYSTVLIESLLLGTPVITTDVGSCREVINGNDYGLIVDNSEEGIYMGVKNVLDNKDFISLMKKNIKNNFAYSKEESIRKINLTFNEE